MNLSVLAHIFETRSGLDWLRTAVESWVASLHGLQYTELQHTVFIKCTTQIHKKATVHNLDEYFYVKRRKES